MFGYRPFRCENQSLAVETCGHRLLPKVRFRRFTRLQEPKNAARYLLQQAHPNSEHIWSKLVQGIETSEDEALVGQSDIAARRSDADCRSLVVIGLVGIRQIDE